MPVFEIDAAKAELALLIERARRGDEVIIADRGSPLARLVPVPPRSGARRPGTLKGQFRVTEAFFEPLPDDELDAWGQ